MYEVVWHHARVEAARVAPKLLFSKVNQPLLHPSIGFSLTPLVPCSYLSCILAVLQSCNSQNMRASSAMKLLSACCGGFLISMPGALVDAVTAKKMYYDYRPAGDFETQGANCGEFSGSLQNATAGKADSSFHVVATHVVYLYSCIGKADDGVLRATPQVPLKPIAIDMCRRLGCVTGTCRV